MRASIDHKNFKLNMGHGKRRFNEAVLELVKKDNYFYFQTRFSKKSLSNSNRTIIFLDIKVSHKKTILFHKNCIITDSSQELYFLKESSKSSLTFHFEVQALPFSLKSINSNLHTLISCACCSSFILSYQNTSPLSSFIQSWISQLFSGDVFPNIADLVSLFNNIEFSQHELDFSILLLDKFVDLINAENENILITRNITNNFNEAKKIIYTDNSLLPSLRNQSDFSNFSFFSGITHYNTFIFKTKSNYFFEIKNGEIRRIESIPPFNQFIRLIFIPTTFYINWNNNHFDHSILRKTVNVALCQIDQNLTIDHHQLTLGYLLFRSGILFYAPDKFMLPRYPASLQTIATSQNFILSPKVSIKSKFSALKFSWINFENQKYFAPVFRPDLPKKRILFDRVPQIMSQDNAGDKMIIGFQQQIAERNLKPFYFFPCSISTRRLQDGNFGSKVKIHFSGPPNLLYLPDTAFFEYIKSQNYSWKYLLFMDQSKICLFDLSTKDSSSVLSVYRKITNSDQFIVIYDQASQARVGPTSEIVKR